MMACIVIARTPINRRTWQSRRDPSVVKLTQDDGEGWQDDPSMGSGQAREE
ncbi:hypothetical protein KKC08_04055 [Patescibacteria group bacterium]|nr:hypothetical protein [Patescibacteria group bacterium]